MLDFAAITPFVESRVQLYAMLILSKPNLAEPTFPFVREKLKDPVGWRNMLSQVFLDQCVHHPLMYFPVFYSLKEVVAGGSACWWGRHVWVWFVL